MGTWTGGEHAFLVELVYERCRIYQHAGLREAPRGRRSPVTKRQLAAALPRRLKYVSREFHLCPRKSQVSLGVLTLERGLVCGVERRHRCPA